jgi:cell division septal protein FtsQ
MRLRHKSPNTTSARHRQPDAELRQTTPTFAYRASRSEEELNLERHSGRSKAQAAKAAPNRLKHLLLRRFGLVILLLALLASSVNILTVSSQITVVPLTATTDSGNSLFLHDKTVYQAATSKLVASSLWNRNKITINTAHIDQQLLQQFPELSSATITLPLLGKRPIVYLQTSQPALILVASDGSFVLDDSGKALLMASKLPSNSSSSLPLITDQSGLHAELNKQVLPTGDISFIQTVVAQLSASSQHFMVTSLVLPPAASELDVRLSGQPYTVKFNLEITDARQQVGTFLATQAQLQNQHITPASYIDVRVDGRAYYK